MLEHKNRIVVVGRNYQDAQAFAQDGHFRDDIESPVLISAAAHRLVILGSLGGMHVGTVYITGRAPLASNFPVVEEAIVRLRRTNPALNRYEQPAVVEA